MFRDIIIFLAGAMFLHGISHLVLGNFIQLPLDLSFMTLTPTLNVWVISISFVITVALLIWARKLKRN